jgi:glutathione S-transferase
VTLRIYGIPKSRAFRVLWIAQELGLPYENFPVDFSARERPPELLAANPMGRIPAIDDDGFTLFESLAITLYLAKKHSPGRLYPAALEDEARCWQWSLWGANEVELPAVDVVKHRHVLEADKRDDAVAQAALARLARPIAVLEAHLAKRAFMLGEGFTIADLNVASLLYTSWFYKADIGLGPATRAWLDRVFARPAAQAARKLRE